MEKLTNLEEMIMKCIWDYGEEIPFLQIGKELKERYGKEYKRTSIRTYLFRLEDKELVIPNAEVSLMNVMGQETYQVTGKAHEVAIDEELVIPDEDIEMVANQANVSEDEAKAALEDTNGDLAEAILKLNQ